MKDEEKKVNANLQNEEEKKVRKLSPKEQQEQDELLFKADSISPANKKVDKNEIELNNGEKVDIDEYIRENFSGKATHYYKSFYNLIADLMGEPRAIMQPFVKPPIVAKLKSGLLYSRFPNAVQAKIYQKNPYTGYCTRSYFNYQCLTTIGDIKLRKFIMDFEEVGAEVLLAGGNLKNFINIYCTKFNLPIQLELF